MSEPQPVVVGREPPKGPEAYVRGKALARPASGLPWPGFEAPRGHRRLGNGYKG